MPPTRRVRDGARMTIARARTRRDFLRKFGARDDDEELIRAAVGMIRNHGTRARAEAQRRAEHMLICGAATQAARWSEISLLIDRIEAGTQTVEPRTRFQNRVETKGRAASKRLAR